MSVISTLNYCLHPFIFTTDKLIKGQHITFNIDVNGIPFVRNTDLFDYIIDYLADRGLCQVDGQFTADCTMSYRGTSVKVKRGMKLSSEMPMFLLRLAAKGLFNPSISDFAEKRINPLFFVLSDEGIDFTVTLDLNHYKSIKDMFDAFMKIGVHDKLLSDESSKEFKLSVKSPIVSTKEYTFKDMEGLQWAVVGSIAYAVRCSNLTNQFVDNDTWVDALKENGYEEYITDVNNFTLYYSWCPRGTISEEDTVAIYSCNAESYSVDISGNSLLTLLEHMVNDIRRRFYIDGKLIYDAVHEVILMYGKYSSKFELKASDIDSIIDNADIITSNRKQLTIDKPDIFIKVAGNKEYYHIHTIDENSYEELKVALLGLRDNSICKQYGIKSNIDLLLIHVGESYGYMRLPIGGYNTVIDELCKRIFEKCARVQKGELQVDYLDSNIFTSKHDVLVTMSVKCGKESKEIYRFSKDICFLDDIPDELPDSNELVTKSVDFMRECNLDKHTFEIKVSVGKVYYSCSIEDADKALRRVLDMCQIISRQFYCGCSSDGGEQCGRRTAVADAFASAINKMTK